MTTPQDRREPGGQVGVVALGRDPRLRAQIATIVGVAILVVLGGLGLVGPLDEAAAPSPSGAPRSGAPSGAPSTPSLATGAPTTGPLVVCAGAGPGSPPTVRLRSTSGDQSPVPGTAGPSPSDGQGSSPVITAWTVPGLERGLLLPPGASLVLDAQRSVCIVSVDVAIAGVHEVDPGSTVAETRREEPGRPSKDVDLGSLSAGDWVVRVEVTFLASTGRVSPTSRVAFFRVVARSSRATKRLFVREDDEAVSPFAALAPGITTRFTLDDTLMPPGAFGEVNAENAALAAAIARWFGVPEEAIGRALRKFRGLPGRMEFVQKEPFGVVVDYAHTPDSLTKVYASLQKDYAGLVCVVGAAGGGRDRWKRSAMGSAAAKHCRFVVVTDEDPYDEDPAAILAEIEQGFKAQNFSAYETLLDRRAAIRRAIGLARPGEAVVLTGKGSETGIHRARGLVEPWDDAEAARQALRARGLL